MILFPRRLTRRALIALSVLWSALAAEAAGAQPVTVRDAWVRAPAPGQKVAAAYMELTGRVSSTLIGVASPAAGAVKLHSTTVEAGVMKMRPVGSIGLPAGKPVKLAPGGMHLMLIDLKRPLKPDDKVPLTLTVQRADSTSRSIFTVQAVVRAAGAGEAHHHH